MHSIITSSVALAALAVIPSVSAHGYIMEIQAGGRWYPANDPHWIQQDHKPPRAGWYANNLDLGFVSPSQYKNADDITCHKQATPGTEYIPVNAGEQIELHWNGRSETQYVLWAEGHHGPVINALAKCEPDCTTANPADLNFFVFEHEGMLKPAESSKDMGFWAADIMRTHNNTWTMTVPHVPSGNYVLRHEFIALQGAGHFGHAQNYPQCVNLKISGGSGSDPCSSGYQCKKATEFYSPRDPGIFISIHKRVTKYIIPGPAVWMGARKKLARVAQAFSA